jgi:hypothetical protein
LAMAAWTVHHGRSPSPKSSPHGEALRQ